MILSVADSKHGSYASLWFEKKMTFYMVVSFYIYDCFEIINEDDSQNYGQHYNHPQHGSLLLHKNYRQKTVSGTNENQDSGLRQA